MAEPINTANLTTATSYGTGLAAFVAGLTLNEWAAIVGIIAVPATWLLNGYFKYREDARQQEIHDLAVKRILERRNKKPGEVTT